jgi:hypothetical protein
MSKLLDIATTSLFELLSTLTGINTTLFQSGFSDSHFFQSSSLLGFPPDLLSGTKTGSGKSSGNGPGRLVCHHVEPVGTCMPECILQIHPFQSAEITSQRILVYHSGIVARKLNGSQQAGVY